MNMRDLYGRAIKRGDFESAYALRLELVGEHPSACHKNVTRDIARGRPKLPSERRLGA